MQPATAKAATVPREGPFLLGIDVGSSSARAIVYDGRGEAVVVEYERYAWTATGDGGLEIAGDRLVEVAASAIDRAVAACRRRKITIAAAGISTFWHGLVGIDGSGRPVTPVFSWGDTRASAAAAELRETEDSAAYHARTGSYFHPSFPLTKLRWLARERSVEFRRVSAWISAGDFLTLVLLGERMSSVSMASASGLFHQQECDWDDESLSIARIERSALFPVAPDGHLGSLTGAWRERWPELSGIPFTLAYGDGACANIGSGCLAADRAALSVGTTAAIRVVVSGYSSEVPVELWAYRIDRHRRVLGGATSNGGNVFAWCSRSLRLPADAETIESQLGSLEPDAHGLTVLPFIAGERSPGWPLGATAAIEGITVATDPVEILRASLEAIAYRLARLRNALRRAIPRAETLVASGRAVAESPVFAQIVCDALGEPLHVSSFMESSSRGAALIAGELTGLVKGMDFPTPDLRVLEPDRRNTEIYASAIERQRRLEERGASFRA